MLCSRGFLADIFDSTRIFADDEKITEHAPVQLHSPPWRLRCARDQDVGTGCSRVSRMRSSAEKTQFS
jgi:hypothetical protein